MKTLRILFTVISAVCIAAFLPVGATLGWGYAAIFAAAAFCFFALMLLCKQSQPPERTQASAPDETSFEGDFFHPANSKADDKDEKRPVHKNK